MTTDLPYWMHKRMSLEDCLEIGFKPHDDNPDLYILNQENITYIYLKVSDHQLRYAGHFPCIPISDDKKSNYEKNKTKGDGG